MTTTKALGSQAHAALARISELLRRLQTASTQAAHKHRDSITTTAALVQDGRVNLGELRGLLDELANVPAIEASQPRRAPAANPGRLKAACEAFIREAAEAAEIHQHKAGIADEMARLFATRAGNATRLKLRPENVPRFRRELRAVIESAAHPVFSTQKDDR